MVSSKKKKYIPIFYEGQFLCLLETSEEEEEDTAEIEEKDGGDISDEEDIEFQQALLLSVTTNDMKELQFQQGCLASSSSTQYLKKKGEDKSSCSFLYEISRGDYENGESSITLCVICMDAIPCEAIVQSHCGHSFCRDCIGLYIGERIQEDIAKVNCPESNCKVELKPADCRTFVPKEVYRRWVDAITEARVLALPVFIRCPFEGCEKRFVNDKKEFKIRACPNCCKLFCVDCRVAWHMGKSCEEFKSELELEAQRIRQLGRRRKGRWSDYGGQKLYKID